MRRGPALALLSLVLSLVLALAGCAHSERASSARTGNRHATTSAPSTVAPSRPVTPAAPSTGAAGDGVRAGPCSAAPSRPVHHVVEIYMENHTESDVITSGAAPYQRALATQCATFTDFRTVGSPSYPNYLGATSGSTQGTTSDSVERFGVDNIFRQVRVAGGQAREYHDGASTCAQVGNGNAQKHEPRMSYVGGSDAATMCAETLPLSAFDPNNLPTYAFVVPTLCHDTHDCSVRTGDDWLASFVPRILTGVNYRAGDTLVEIVYDEPTPLANVFLSPSIRPGTRSTAAASHYAELRTNEALLGLPCLAGACSAADLRPALNL